MIVLLLTVFFAASGVAAKPSDAGDLPGDPLDVATRNADIRQLAIIQAIQLAKTFIVPTPDPKNPNQARHEIHNYLPFLCRG